MRILYLHRTQGHGVEAVHIRGMVTAMREAGHEVEVVGPPGTDPFVHDNEPAPQGFTAGFARHAPELLFELAEMTYDRRLAARLAEIGERFEPELLYERFAFNAGAGGAFARRQGIPHLLEVNYTSHDPLVRRRSRLLAPMSRRSESRSFKSATLLATVSSKLEERIAGYGVPRDRVLLTPNAVSRDWWEDAGRVEPVILPEAFADEPVVGFVGGFYPWHGLDRLVEAFRRCREAGLPGNLMLVGDGPERPRIEAQLEECGLRERALFAGPVDHASLPSWIAAMAVCVMPHSNDYGSPMKIFEYMGMGRAVLAPDLPPLRDVIDDGANGRLFAPDNDSDAVAPLQQGLAELLGDDSLRTRLAEAGRLRVGESHTWQENWRRIEAALRDAGALTGGDGDGGHP